MLRALSEDERGTVTAEFAIVVPAVLALLGLVIGAVSLAAQRVALVSITAEAARLEARGDTDAAQEVLGRLDANATLKRDTIGGLRCLTVRSRLDGGPLAMLAIEARSCAAPFGAGVL
ncbi:TadE/TadG family type IV pilus assembly protein [Leucobacter sp. USHLN153]|uniref:TadE/TadG family type IV pilus assembly protein n=1 Tax=Leucobacter sp. USHLN153 TaxID=3081268 RepID=UPI00301803B2